MQDFDFDEIDRAVNGVIGDTPSTPVSTPVAPVIPATPQVSAAPVVDPASAPAARRSAGRFMDVVHPSSDMRTRSTPVAPREAIAAQPVAAPAAEPVFEEQPQVSPFLADAKVEKRPLGGVAPVVAAPEPFAFTEPTQELIEAPDEPRIEAEAMPDPIDFANQQTPELSVTTETPVVEESLPEASAVEPEIAPVASESTPIEPTPTLAPEPVVEEPIGPTSITQQYTEQPSSADTPGAIYDTEAYHQPVAAPAKKKRGSLVVLWIALIAIFGAGAGAAIYFFVLQPML